MSSRMYGHGEKIRKTFEGLSIEFYQLYVIWKILVYISKKSGASTKF